MDRARIAPYAQQGLFGLIDGLNGAVGLVIGLLHSHAGAQLVFVALLSRAGSSAVSMAGAEYEADDAVPMTRKVKSGRIAAMGLGYLTSALLPGLGFAVSTRAGLIVFIPATAAILCAITWFRSQKAGWLKAGATTFTIFALAVAAGLAASLIG